MYSLDSLEARPILLAHGSLIRIASPSPMLHGITGDSSIELQERAAGDIGDPLQRLSAATAVVCTRSMARIAGTLYKHNVPVRSIDDLRRPAPRNSPSFSAATHSLSTSEFHRSVPANANHPRIRASHRRNNEFLRPMWRDGAVTGNIYWSLSISGEHLP